MNIPNRFLVLYPSFWHTSGYKLLPESSTIMNRLEGGHYYWMLDARSLPLGCKSSMTNNRFMYTNWELLFNPGTNIFHPMSAQMI